MAHVVEHAATGRAMCRGCGNKILKDELRFGEKEPNAFGEGEMTLWFHLPCAAYKRPGPFLEMLKGVEEEEITADEQAAAHAGGHGSSGGASAASRSSARWSSTGCCPT